MEKASVKEQVGNHCLARVQSSPAVDTRTPHLMTGQVGFHPPVTEECSHICFPVVSASVSENIVCGRQYSDRNDGLYICEGSKLTFCLVCFELMLSPKIFL